MTINCWHRMTQLVKWLIAALFIFAGVSKILDPADFAHDIDNYRLLPYLLVTLLAAVLPWLEVLAGIFLVIGNWSKGASFLLLTLSVMFLIAISSALARGLDISCGCFAKTLEGTKIGYTKLIEDVILFLALLVISLREEKNDQKASC